MAYFLQHSNYLQMKSKQIWKLIGLLLLSSCTVFNVLPSKKIQHIEFSDDPANEKYNFVYQNFENSPDLEVFKSLYALDSVADLGNSEFEKISHLLKWTNGRWEHSGSNEPSESNTFTILKEASEGKKFRCVEYGIVLRTVLASNDFSTRTLGLKTRDVETTKFGAGHVLTEVWSSQFNKWFMLDAQFNIVPVLDDIPLNAVEFQNAIIQDKNFKLVNIEGEVDSQFKQGYMSFIPHYLYYFDFAFDQREVPNDELLKVNGKGNLMLVPLGAKQPTVFQRKWPMNYYEYTRSLRDFYRKPE